MVSGLFVPLTIHTMEHSYHSLIPGVIERPARDSAHQQRRGELTLQAQHQGSSWTAWRVPAGTSSDTGSAVHDDADRPAVGAVSNNNNNNNNKQIYNTPCMPTEGCRGARETLEKKALQKQCRRHHDAIHSWLHDVWNRCDTQEIMQRKFLRAASPLYL